MNKVHLALTMVFGGNLTLLALEAIKLTMLNAAEMSKL